MTAPTCTAQGYTTHTCSACGDSYKDTYTNALGHSYGYKVTTTPTTSAAGKLTGTCSRCSATTTVTLPKLNTTDYTYSVVKAATCTTTGTGRYVWKTTAYGTFQFDVTLAKTSHSYKTTVTAPTCTAQGYTTHTCSACGDSYKDSYVAATGHAWDNGVETEKATCTQPGTLVYTCANCGKTRSEEVSPAGHTYVTAITAPTCTAQGYTTHTCSVCGDSYKSNYVGATGHAWDNGIETEKATCTLPGTLVYTCANCGKTRSEEVSPTGHTYVTVVSAPTCTAQGYTTHTCSACGDSYKDSYLAAAGHAWDNGKETEKATCTQPGTLVYTCANCGETKSEKQDSIGHSYAVTITAPTCTTQGYTTHICSVCGDNYVSDYVPALGHSYAGGVCSRCGVSDPNYTPDKPEPPTPLDKCDGGEKCPSRPYSDVNTKQWYHLGIDYALENKLMNGMGGGKFEPNGSMTRAMLVTVLWRYAGSPAEGTNGFSDVPNGDWYTQAVAWASKNGVVNGVGNGKFDPNGKITREQMAVILFRYANQQGINTGKRGDFGKFADANKVSGYAADALQWAVAEGIVGGSSEGGKLLLNPQGNATRAEVATILMRFLENVMK